MTYHGNTQQKTAAESEDEESMSLYEVMYDGPKGTTVEPVRAVNGREAEKIVKNDNPRVVVHTVDEVDYEVEA